MYALKYDLMNVAQSIVISYINYLPKENVFLDSLNTFLIQNV